MGRRPYDLDPAYILGCKEGETPEFSDTYEFKDSAGVWQPVLLADVTSLKLTYYDAQRKLDDATGVINGRDHTPIVTNGAIVAGAAFTFGTAAPGMLTWQLAAAETKIRYPLKSSELHLVLVELVLSGSRAEPFEYGVRVKNLRRVAVP